jgi:hypothetical protein
MLRLSPMICKDQWKPVKCLDSASLSFPCSKNSIRNPRCLVLSSDRNQISISSDDMSALCDFLLSKLHKRQENHRMSRPLQCPEKNTLSVNVCVCVCVCVCSPLLSSFLLRSKNAHRGTACLVFFPLPSDIKNPLATIECLESHELFICTLKLPHNRWHVSFDPVNQNKIGDCICLRLLLRLCTLSFVLKRGRRMLYVRFPESFQKTSEKSICLCLRLRVHPLQTRNLQERKLYRDISMSKPAYMPPMPPSSLLSKKAVWKSHVRTHQKLRMNKQLISNPA